MINIPKGTKDVLPAESHEWHYVERVARETARLFRCREIRTPTFEHTEVFLRGVGDTTDIVNKEMYTFLDKGNRSITLKPEGTAGVCRSFIENGLANETLPLKMYYLTPVFRYERPQAGRLREHHQFGVEFYGSASYVCDAEIISLADTFFKRLGIGELTVELNSIGCKECRPKYNRALKDYYTANLDKLCPLCRERLEKNPLRILDCKEEGCIEVNKGAPLTLDYLCPECEEHFEGLKKTLGEFGVKYEVNPRIVRGLDYYTRTVFEFVSDRLGAKSTVCGGGRYDGLNETLGGKPMPAAGFGLGLERLLLTMSAMGIAIPDEEKPEVYVAPLKGEGADTLAAAHRLTAELRGAGISADTDSMDRSLKAQFKFADKIGANYVVVVGPGEVESGKISLRDMRTKQETPLEFGETVKYLSEKVL